MQVLGKPVRTLHAFFRHPDLLIEIHLAAVGLVGNADDVIALSQQFGVFSEFVNRREKDAAALSILEQLAQVIAAFYTDHRLIADVSLGIGELQRKLVIQIRTIGDPYDR